MAPVPCLPRESDKSSCASGINQSPIRSGANGLASAVSSQHPAKAYPIDDRTKTQSPSPPRSAKCATVFAAFQGVRLFAAALATRMRKLTCATLFGGPSIAKAVVSALGERSPSTLSNTWLRNSLMTSRRSPSDKDDRWPSTVRRYFSSCSGYASLTMDLFPCRSEQAVHPMRKVVPRTGYLL